jgi:hypothetical protein
VNSSTGASQTLSVARCERCSQPFSSRQEKSQDCPKPMQALICISIGMWRGRRALPTVTGGTPTGQVQLSNDLTVLATAPPADPLPSKPQPASRHALDRRVLSWRSQPNRDGVGNHSHHNNPVASPAASPISITLN